MIFVGDVHINSQYKDKIISSLRKELELNKTEKNIIFMGDFVYHFSYDRSALLMFFEFLIELFLSGKEIYLLAGNHDWLGQHFVFQEAKTSFDILSKHNIGIGKIHFITEPQIINIESENILMMPYCLDYKKYCKDSLLNSYIETTQYKENIINIINTIKILKNSDNTYEQQSGFLNQVILQNILSSRITMIIHHHYTNNISFPGQKSKFTYKNICISHEFINIDDIKIISGHLHQPFLYKNYLCIGSIWATSPLETNSLKGIFIYNNGSIRFQNLDINNHFLVFMCDIDNKIDNSNLNHKIKEIYTLCKTYFEGNFRGNVAIEIDVEKIETSLKNSSLSIIVEDINYEQINSYIDVSLQESMRDIKLKKKPINNLSISDNLDLGNKNLSYGFGDRKLVLQEYIKLKYINESEKYFQKLKDLKLL